LRAVADFHARGHANVIARHPTTFEITKHAQLTKRGDCVIAVEASKGLADFSTEFRNLCKRDEARIIVQLKAAGIVESIEGNGSCGLTLSHPTEMVGRKSTFVSDRTMMIRADRAACDISRDLISKLQSPSTTLHVRVIAEV
jgi:hypothetical protein